jgi:hypothetical protein
MGDPILRSWSTDEFFAWQENQPDRYELVDGRPLKMMAGAKNVHDDIVVNLIAELREQLRGSGCRPCTGEEGQWVEQRIRGLDAKIEMAKLGVVLSMDAIYEGVEFPTVPRALSCDRESGAAT